MVTLRSCCKNVNFPDKYHIHIEVSKEGNEGQRKRKREERIKEKEEGGKKRGREEGKKEGERRGKGRGEERGGKVRKGFWVRKGDFHKPM